MIVGEYTSKLLSLLYRISQLCPEVELKNIKYEKKMFTGFLRKRFICAAELLVRPNILDLKI